ncbi:MAG: hypothetical protein K2N64_01945 [Anaeroplasmataceae bacterium]|nr:hypothetical protein [Anaeroplasmataceae bacterium]
MMIAIIIAIICSITAFVLLIVDIIMPSFLFSAITFIFWLVTLIVWLYISLYLINRKRREIFSKKISSLDRSNEKLENLFVLLDYIEGREQDVDIVSKALMGIYFSPAYMRKNPEKAKKRDLYNLLIEYYLTLTRDKYTDSFIWDYNINFFTWRCIGVTSLVGGLGIFILLICQNTIPNPNDVLYTALYFVFGGLLVPLLAKFFGHFI